MDTGALIAIIISAAAFLMTVLGPLLTSLIQCHHETAMYENRFNIEHRHEVIEKYLKSAGKYVFSGEFKNREEFGEASAEIFMYAPKELWSDIRELNITISEAFFIDDYQLRQKCLQQAQAKYFSLCEKFSFLHRPSRRKSDRR